MWYRSFDAMLCMMCRKSSDVWNPTWLEIAQPNKTRYWLSSRWATELLWQRPEECICEIVEKLCVWNVSYCILLEIKLLLLLYTAQEDKSKQQSVRFWATKGRDRENICGLNTAKTDILGHGKVITYIVSNYIHSIHYSVITYPCSRYLILALKFSHMRIDGLVQERRNSSYVFLALTLRYILICVWSWVRVGNRYRPFLLTISDKSRVVYIKHW